MLSRYFVCWPRDGRVSLLAALQGQRRDRCSCHARVVLRPVDRTAYAALSAIALLGAEDDFLRRDLARSKIVDDRRR